MRSPPAGSRCRRAGRRALGRGERRMTASIRSPSCSRPRCSRSCLLLTLDPVSAGVALVLELAADPVRRHPAGASSGSARCRSVDRRTARRADDRALRAALRHACYAECLLVAGQRGVALARGSRPRCACSRSGCPRVVLFVTIDPTDLADGLAQTLHLPARFVLGALAGDPAHRPRRRRPPHRRTRPPCPRRRRPRPAASPGRGSPSRCSCCRSAAAARSRSRWRRADSARPRAHLGASRRGSGCARSCSR